MAAFLLFTHVVFVPCSQVTLEFFNCTPRLEGLPQFLVDDATTKCYTNEYNWFIVYALAMVFVYPLGTPLMYLSLLWRHRNDIDPILNETTQERGRMKEDKMKCLQAMEIRENNPTIQQLSFLWDGYEPEFWWWEVYVCFERLL